MILQGAVAAKPCTGICHLCLSGRPGFDFENCRPDAPWWATCNVELPWDSEPSILETLHDPTNPADFFFFDVWHNSHLGMLKCKVSSDLAEIHVLFPERSVLKRFELMSESYLQHCKAAGRQPHVNGIDRDLIGWLSNTDEPSGHWSKGAMTTNLMDWLEAVFRAKDLSVDPAFEIMAIKKLYFHDFLILLRAIFCA